MKNETNVKKHRHMSYQDRVEIQECLYKKMTFKAIAKLIGKDPTTISKEVKLHSKIHKNGFTKCDGICPHLQKAPFVCNGCKLKSSASCKFPRKLYTAKVAHNEYSEVLVSSREGIALNNASFYENDKIISDKIKSGQHLYHIVQSSQIPFSLSSAYRYMNKGYLSASVLDLPRAVKFKPRKHKYTEYIPKALKIGRTYADFLLYLENEDISSYHELDTLIGDVGGKVIVTIHFPQVNFMFGLLADNKTSAEVASKITDLKQRLFLNNFIFADIFPLFLTDNGGEFSDIASLELDMNSSLYSKVFFCDPMQSSQKPFIEKNHTLFRDIVPKGSSFDNFTQETVNLIFSHVNSVKRKSLNGKSAFDMFSFLFSESLTDVLGIHRIHHDEVIQSPALQKTRPFINSLLK